MNRKKRIHRQELRTPEVTPEPEIKKAKPKAKAKPAVVKAEENKGE